MTVLLDTTVLIDLLRGKPQGIAIFRQLLASGHVPATSAINVGEVYSGVRPHELNNVQRLFAEMEIYPVSFSIAKHAGELRNSAARKGITLELDDMLVASTALEYGISIITANIKDFKPTGVSFYRSGEN
jgi:predicted nucleic acid-binding protein